MVLSDATVVRHVSDLNKSFYVGVEDPDFGVFADLSGVPYLFQ